MRHTFENNPTIFGKILRGEIPNSTVYEDDYMLAFHDIAPRAKVHVVVIPKVHLTCLRQAEEADKELLGHMMVTIPKIAAKVGLAESGYRVISNAGPDSGQEVPHLHFQILGGEPLAGL